jgi:hypothetical protein
MDPGDFFARSRRCRRSAVTGVSSRKEINPMACFLLILALATPRLVIILLWLLSHWFDGLFATPVVPVLGFVFLPTTFLWYTAVQHWYGGAWGGLVPIVGLIIALMVDLHPIRGRYRRRAED